MSTIKDLNLAESGERKIRWVEAHMPVLRDIGSDFAREAVCRSQDRAVRASGG